MYLSFPQFLILSISLLIFQVEQSNGTTNRDSSNDESTALKEEDQRQQRRKLIEYPFYDWYQNEVARGEEITASEATQNGHWPNLTCPLGTYREFGSVGQRIPGGLRLEG
jgi:hypothetical protein